MMVAPHLYHPTPPELILWSVVEEHLDESEFLFEQWESALLSPIFTLDELAAPLEERLLAHIKGLVVGGSAVAERLLATELEETTDPERATVAALAMLESGDRDRWHDVFDALAFADDEEIASAVARALALSEASRFDLALRSEFESASSPREKAVFLDVLASRRLDPGPSLAQCLTSDFEPLCRAGVRAAGRLCRPDLLAKVEDHLCSRAPELRLAAIEAGLALGSETAWWECRKLASGQGEAAAQPLLLVALLGGPTEHQLIHRQLEDDSMRPAALWALGFTGYLASADRCLPFLESGDDHQAKLAAEALTSIIGLDLIHDQALQLPEPEEIDDEPVGDDDDDERDPFPPELDDLDADLVPAPIDELPRPDAEAIRDAYRANRDTFSPDRRYLYGEPYGAGALLCALQDGPMRRRHALALELFIRTKGARSVMTDGFSSRQRRELAVLSTLDPKELR